MVFLLPPNAWSKFRWNNANLAFSDWFGYGSDGYYSLNPRPPLPDGWEISYAGAWFQISLGFSDRKIKEISYEEELKMRYERKGFTVYREDDSYYARKTYLIFPEAIFNPMTQNANASNFYYQ